MCGMSFSAKSTFAALLAPKLDAAVISLDAINEERGFHGGQGIPVEEWGRTSAIAHERARRALSGGCSVLIDDTGSPRFLRDAWRETAETHGGAFALVWVCISAELQHQRLLASRKTRDRHDVTDEVMAQHVAGFEEPLDENPIVVEAVDAASDARADEVASLIRADETLSESALFDEDQARIALAMDPRRAQRRRPRLLDVGPALVAGRRYSAYAVASGNSG
ncbi:AAA family ATPase [Gryllotalpicola reticulitermitis]|uniref:AAA family ATPase n=1 Tax=Gryllotalpicola reticulitermitis TaxID=1184153 RepID=A0ABV8QBB9_9MICO